MGVLVVTIRNSLALALNGGFFTRSPHGIWMKKMPKNAWKGGTPLESKILAKSKRNMEYGRWFAGALLIAIGMLFLTNIVSLPK